MSASSELDRLEARDRLAELLALLRVGECEVVGALREPDAHRGDRDPAAVEDLEELLEALAARAEQVSLGHGAVAERELARVGGLPAELLHRRRDLVAGVPFGTTMFEISSSPVRAVIVTHPVMSVPAFVMNIFEPFDDPAAVPQLGGRQRRCRRRSRRRARSARTRRACARRRGRAATRASAPRSRRGRSASSRARCARRP